MPPEPFLSLVYIYIYSSVKKKKKKDISVRFFGAFILNVRFENTSFYFQRIKNDYDLFMTEIDPEIYL